MAPNGQNFGENDTVKSSVCDGQSKHSTCLPGKSTVAPREHVNTEGRNVQISSGNLGLFFDNKALSDAVVTSSMVPKAAVEAVCTLHSSSDGVADTKSADTSSTYTCGYVGNAELQRPTNMNMDSFSIIWEKFDRLAQGLNDDVKRFVQQVRTLTGEFANAALCQAKPKIEDGLRNRENFVALNVDSIDQRIHVTSSDGGCEDAVEAKEDFSSEMSHPAAEATEFSRKEKVVQIANGSRMLDAVEMNYSTAEKKLLAIVWGVKHFRSYLYGKKFIIITDHRDVEQILYIKDPDSRLGRWRLELEQYEYEVVYEESELNANAVVTQTSTLKRPNSTKPFILTTNISSNIVNADLSQVEKDSRGCFLEADESCTAEGPREFASAVSNFSTGTFSIIEELASFSTGMGSEFSSKGSVGSATMESTGDDQHFAREITPCSSIQGHTEEFFDDNSPSLTYCCKNAAIEDTDPHFSSLKEFVHLVRKPNEDVSNCATRQKMMTVEFVEATLHRAKVSLEGTVPYNDSTTNEIHAEAGAGEFKFAKETECGLLREAGHVAESTTFSIAKQNDSFTIASENCVDGYSEVCTARGSHGFGGTREFFVDVEESFSTAIDGKIPGRFLSEDGAYEQSRGEEMENLELLTPIYLEEFANMDSSKQTQNGTIIGCFNCGSDEHSAINCNVEVENLEPTSHRRDERNKELNIRHRSSATQDFSITCNHCTKPGHNILECYKLKKQLGIPRSAMWSFNESNPCQDQHDNDDVKMQSKSTLTVSTQPTQSKTRGGVAVQKRMIVAADQSQQKSHVILRADELKQPTIFLVDSGAVVSIIKKNKLRGKVFISDDAVSLQGITKQNIPTLGKVTIFLQIGSEDLGHEFYVVPNDFPTPGGIIGNDVLESPDISVRPVPGEALIVNRVRLNFVNRSEARDIIRAASSSTKQSPEEVGSSTISRRKRKKKKHAFVNMINTLQCDASFCNDFEIITSEVLNKIHFAWKSMDLKDCAKGDGSLSWTSSVIAERNIHPADVNLTSELQPFHQNGPNATFGIGPSEVNKRGQLSKTSPVGKGAHFKEGRWKNLSGNHHFKLGTIGNGSLCRIANVSEKSQTRRYFTTSGKPHLERRRCDIELKFIAPRDIVSLTDRKHCNIAVVSKGNGLHTTCGINFETTHWTTPLCLRVNFSGHLTGMHLAAARASEANFYPATRHGATHDWIIRNLLLSTEDILSSTQVSWTSEIADKQEFEGFFISLDGRQSYKSSEYDGVMLCIHGDFNEDIQSLLFGNSPIATMRTETKGISDRVGMSLVSALLAKLLTEFQSGQYDVTKQVETHHGGVSADKSASNDLMSEALKTDIGSSWCLSDPLEDSKNLRQEYRKTQQVNNENGSRVSKQTGQRSGEVKLLTLTFFKACAAEKFTIRKRRWIQQKVVWTVTCSKPSSMMNIGNETLRKIFRKQHNNDGRNFFSRECSVNQTDHRENTENFVEMRKLSSSEAERWLTKFSCTRKFVVLRKQIDEKFVTSVGRKLPKIMRNFNGIDGKLSKDTGVFKLKRRNIFNGVFIFNTKMESTECIVQSKIKRWGLIQDASQVRESVFQSHRVLEKETQKSELCNTLVRGEQRVLTLLFSANAEISVDQKFAQLSCKQRGQEWIVTIGGGSGRSEVCCVGRGDGEEIVWWDTEDRTGRGGNGSGPRIVNGKYLDGYRPLLQLLRFMSHKSFSRRTLYYERLLVNELNSLRTQKFSWRGTGTHRNSTPLQRHSEPHRSLRMQHQGEIRLPGKSVEIKFHSVIMLGSINPLIGGEETPSIGSFHCMTRISSLEDDADGPIFEDHWWTSVEQGSIGNQYLAAISPEGSRAGQGLFDCYVLLQIDISSDTLLKVGGHKCIALLTLWIPAPSEPAGCTRRKSNVERFNTVVMPRDMNPQLKGRKDLSMGHFDVKPSKGAGGPAFSVHLEDVNELSN